MSNDTCGTDFATWLDGTEPDPAYTLEVPCTSLDDTNCLCITANTVDWDGKTCLGDTPGSIDGQCPREQYFNSDAYIALTRTEKLNQLWD